MARTLLALLFVCLLQPAAIGEEDPAPWLESLAEAKRIATRDGRLILVYLDPDCTRGATTRGPDSLSDLVLRRVAEKLLVVLAQRTSAGEIVTERGTHLRIDATR